MSEITIAQRYSKALYDLAESKKCVDEVYASMQDLARLLVEVPALKEFIHNPLLSIDERNKVLTALFKKKFPDLVFKFLLFISFKARLNLLSEMTQTFDGLYLEAHGQSRAQIQTALPLNESVKQQFANILSKKYAKTVLPQWQIRQDILGGFRILIEGYLHDSSFTSQLAKYRQSVLT